MGSKKKLVKCIGRERTIYIDLIGISKRKMKILKCILRSLKSFKALAGKCYKFKTISRWQIWTTDNALQLAYIFTVNVFFWEWNKNKYVLNPFFWQMTCEQTREIQTLIFEYLVAVLNVKSVFFLSLHFCAL